MLALKSLLPALAAGLIAASPAFAQDPLADLSKNVTAVIDPGPAGKILVVEESHGASNVRTLGVGDGYGTGWKIETIAANAVTLKKGAESRTVPVLGKEGGPAVAEAGAPVAAFTAAAPRPARTRTAPGLPADLEEMLAQSNAMLAAMSPEQKAQINAMMAAEADRRAANAPQTLDAAIAAGDPESVSRLGGTMRDFMRASMSGASGVGGMTQEQIDRMPASMLDRPAPTLPPMPRTLEEAQALMTQLQSGDLGALMGLPGIPRPADP